MILAEVVSTAGQGAPIDATYITQTANGTLSGEQALSALATGIVKNTTVTGVLSIAAAGTDYEVPLTFGDGLTRTGNDIDVDIIQNITTLSNLTSNGFVKTGGGIGTLSVDTSTYLTGNQTITLSGDVSGSGDTAITTTIGSDKITESMLKAVDTAVDEDILTYEAATGDFEWHSVSEVKTAMSLNLVENTALSTWVGSANITTLGTIGTGTWNAGSVTSSGAVTAASFVIGANTLTTSEWAFLDGQNQAVATTSSPTFVNLTITSFAANWTNAGRTVADLGTITTADINGGTIDGAVIGGSSAAAITGTTITATTFRSVTADVADAGVIRLANAETIAWEASPAGTDVTITVDSSERFACSAAISATTGYTIAGVAGSGTILRGNGTNFVASTFTIPDTYTTGNMLYASATNVLSALASGATAGMYLRNGGASTAPLWSTLILPNAITANQVVYGSASNTYGASVNLTFDGTNLTCAGQVFGTVHVFNFPLPGTQTAGTNKMGAQFIIPFACTIVKVYANAGTAPTGAGII